MSKTASIRARIEPELKTEVENILSELGLTVSETVHLLYRQIKLQRGLPFDVRVPNELVLICLQPGTNTPHPSFRHPLPIRWGEGWGEGRFVPF